MAEFIERQVAIDAVTAVYARTAGYKTRERVWETREAIQKLPAANVAPVGHGRWIRPHWKNSNYCCDCSECGGEAMHRDYQWHKNGIYPICPNCGAIMDGGADNETD